MSVSEIKDKLAALPRKEQDEVIAYLFHLRHVDDLEYKSRISNRLDDKNAEQWVSPDEFERELDKKQPK